MRLAHASAGIFEHVSSYKTVPVRVFAERERERDKTGKTHQVGFNSNEHVRKKYQL
jgi:hypothetical protein